MPVESAIRARVEAFASELVALIRLSAVDVVTEALGGAGPSRRRGSGRSVGAPPSSHRPKGAKRDPKVLAALTEKLGAFIKKNPGQRIEQIGKALSIATKELALPVKKLVAAKMISSKGQKRATTYYGGRGGGAAKKPARSARKARAKGHRVANGRHHAARKAPPKAAPSPKAEAAEPAA